MNQILNNYDKNDSNENHLFVKSSIKSNFLYKIIFTICLVLLISFVFIFINKLYENSKNEQISKILTDSYSISTLYSDNNNYDISNAENTSPFIIRNNKNRQNKCELFYIVHK